MTALRRGFNGLALYSSSPNHDKSFRTLQFAPQCDPAYHAIEIRDNGDIRWNVRNGYGLRVPPADIETGRVGRGFEVVACPLDTAVVEVEVEAVACVLEVDPEVEVEATSEDKEDDEDEDDEAGVVNVLIDVTVATFERVVVISTKVETPALDVTTTCAVVLSTGEMMDFVGKMSGKAIGITVGPTGMMTKLSGTGIIV